MKKITCSILMAFIFLGCATSGKKESDASAPPAPDAQGFQWDTKAQVRDYKNNKTNNLSIDVIAVKNSHMRMEVSAILGYPVASFVSNPQSVRMAIYPQKKFYFGPNSEEALKPIIGFPLNAQVFQDIVFDNPIKGWKCENGNDGSVAACKRNGKNGEVVVAWQERKSDSKRVVIQGPQFEMEWHFKGAELLKPVKPQIFKLDVPSGYKVVPL